MLTYRNYKYIINEKAFTVGGGSWDGGKTRVNFQLQLDIVPGSTGAAVVIETRIFGETRFSDPEKIVLPWKVAQNACLKCAVNELRSR
uniref:Uncharacterized protein n=1 Tax=Globodera rostochiensis TaxID=31243 RepID=A0A914GYL7_GLORO